MIINWVKVIEFRRINKWYVVLIIYQNVDYQKEPFLF